MNKRNYQKELEQVLKEEQGTLPRLLLHSCCAPCSSHVLEYLSPYFLITVFYYNPNIYPETEYRKRVLEQEDFIRRFPTAHPVEFVDGPYEPERFYETVKGMEREPEGKERCFRCYELRILEAVEMAQSGGFDYVTTTLTISPLKNAEKLNEIGERLTRGRGVKWLPGDFKKKEGYKRSIELSAEYKLYRQNYCGCVYSQRQQREMDLPKEA
ncbi:MAG: epoxyqueuosine reductase QueH [Lachnospiraceae bacterium]|nr:epoxyqueuosine reductase QueH [Lachnospiraceae bacterium]